MAVDKGFLENLQGLTTLKIYQADEKKAREMDEESQRFRQITMKVLTMQLNSTSVMDIVAYGGAAAGMIVASLEFLNGHLSFAGALTIILLASEFFIPLRLLGSFFHIAMNGMAASDKISIAITFLTSLIMVFFIGSYHVEAGLLAVVIPIWNGKRGGDKGMAFRNGFGELNSFVLESLRGLDETIQYNQGKARQKELDERSVKLASFQKDLSKMEGSQRSITNFSILGFSLVMLLLTMALYHQGEIGFDAMLICTVAMMGSFGPVVALSSLSNNLNQTLASGERVLSILEETPMVEEIPVRSEGERAGRYPLGR